MAETTLLADPKTVKADARMVAMAVKRGWNIPTDLLETLPTVLGELAANSDEDRTRIGAARVLVAMHGQNQKTDPPPRVVQHVHTMGPVTETNFAERKRLLIERADRSGDDTGGT